MGYHLKFLLNAENGGTSTQSEAFFPFQHAFHEKICLFKCLTLTETICWKIWAQSCPRMVKKSASVDIHHSKKPLLVKLPRIVLITHQI